MATVLQQKRSYQQALKLWKEKKLSRGYGKKFNGTFNGGKGRGKPSGSNKYNMPIEEVRKTTRCWKCNQIAHRAQEDTKEADKVNAAQDLEKLGDTEEAFFVGSLNL